MGGSSGDCIRENDLFYLRNHYDIMLTYLDTCGYAECSTTGLAVQTSAVSDRDGFSGSWSIQMATTSIFEASVGALEQTDVRSHELGIQESATSSEYESMLAETRSEKSAASQSQAESMDSESAEAMSMSLATEEVPASTLLYVLAAIGASSLFYFGYQAACGKSQFALVLDVEEEY